MNDIGPLFLLGSPNFTTDVVMQSSAELFPGGLKQIGLKYSISGVTVNSIPL